jgi:hypothetical protein
MKPNKPLRHSDQLHDSYHFKRFKQDGQISVFNKDGYLMAHYNERLGTTRWERVVPITQRTSIENKLSEQFPARQAAAAKANGR